MFISDFWVNPLHYKDSHLSLLTVSDVVDEGL